MQEGEALTAVSAYIDLNPVRAALYADPKDYRYCGYAEALAKGCPLARQGLRTILGQPETTSWSALSSQYRTLLFVKGSSSSANRAPAFDLASVQRVVEEQKGELALPQRLLCRVTLCQAQAKAGLQTPSACHAFNCSGLSEPLGLP